MSNDIAKLKKTLINYRSLRKTAEEKLERMTKSYVQEKHRRNIIQDRYDKLLRGCLG